VGRGASRRASGGPPRLARLAPALPLALLWPLNASDAVQASVLHREPEMFDYDRYTDADGYGRMGEWVRAHTPAGTVVAAGDTYLFHSGRVPSPCGSPLRSRAATLTSRPPRRTWPPAR
jgi:hypothetical protein